MTLPSTGLVNACVAESLVGLCDAYALKGVERAPLGAVDVFAQLADQVAVVQLRGAGVAGMVALSLPPSLVRRTWPGEADGADLQEDWLGELTNQLMGRLKNMLLGHGLPLLVGGTPAVIPSAAAIEGICENCCWSEFHTPDGLPIVVGIELLPQANGPTLAGTVGLSAELPAAEGDVILF